MIKTFMSSNSETTGKNKMQFLYFAAYFQAGF